ncbi:MAG: DUF2871 domain-containing protein [Oscillospiraceae bacterium]|nr:DUF2871 domain-containing protein [Oscillospiraceae bacterium]
MKKCLNYALCYAILGMCGGVFYREFTRFNNFTGETALGKIHTHFFVLGMFMYLIIALFMRGGDFSDTKLFKAFRGIYNTGVPMTGIMLGFRGVFDVLPDKLSKGSDKAISGIAGIGHILTAAGLILLLIALKKHASEKSEVKS